MHSASKYRELEWTTPRPDGLAAIRHGREVRSCPHVPGPNMYRMCRPVFSNPDRLRRGSHGRHHHGCEPTIVIGEDSDVLTRLRYRTAFQIRGTQPVGRDGAGAPGGPSRPEPGAGSAGPGAAQRRHLTQYGSIRQRTNRPTKAAVQGQTLPGVWDEPETRHRQAGVAAQEGHPPRFLSKSVRAFPAARPSRTGVVTSPASAFSLYFL